MAGPGKYHSGAYTILNPDKYNGNKVPHFRSGWEHAFMRFCDNHPSVINWSSEAIRIPYRNPLTGKQTMYVPDFLVVYQNKTGSNIAELIEIKPKSQTMLTEKTSMRDKAAIAINHAKWQAAAAWCKQKGIRFRIVTEDDIFHQGQKRR